MIGVDIIQIKRIKKAAQSPRFLERVFLPHELEYSNTKADKYATLAGIFAAKEAVSKALKSGMNGLNFKDISIRHDKNGCPFAVVSNRQLDISISHDGGFAIAAALVKTQEPAQTESLVQAGNPAELATIKKT